MLRKNFMIPQLEAIADFNKVETLLLPGFATWVFPLGLMVLGASGVSGQAYPNKPIRIVTGAVGSSSDFQARFIAQGLGSNLTQPVTVENHANILIVEIVAKAPAD